jgi:hypothetical protein
MHWLSQFFYMEVKFGPLEKMIKMIDMNWDEIFETNSYTLFDRKHNEEIL